MSDPRYTGDLGQPMSKNNLNVHSGGLPNPAQSNIMEISNLDRNKFNCDRIFNICCLFGNVQKIKFTTEDTCLVQMYDPSSVDRTILALYKKNFFGLKAHFMPTERTQLNDDQNVFKGPSVTSYSAHFHTLFLCGVEF